MKKIITLLLGWLPLALTAQPMDFQTFRNFLTDVDFEQMHGVAVGSFGTIVTTDDGGTTWTGRKTPVFTTFNSVSFTTANTGWACGTGGVIVKSTDGGVTWTAQTSGTTLDLRKIYAISPSTAIAVGGGGMAVANISTALKTTDGGATWTPLWTDATIPAALKGAAASGTIYYTTLYAVQFVDANTGYICGGLGSVSVANGAGGKIAKTTDGGATWTVSTTAGTAHSFWNLHFFDATNGWVVGNYSSANLVPPNTPGQLVKTTDGGATWSNLINLGEPNVTYRGVAALTATTCVAVNQSNNSMKRTTDNWATIAPVVNGYGSYTNIKNDGAGNLYALGTGGQIYKSNDGLTWTKLNGGTTDFGLTDGDFVDSNIGMIAGSAGKLLTTTNAGSTWSEIITGGSTSFNAVHMTDQNTAFAVGAGGTSPCVKLTNSGGTWTATNVTLPSGTALQYDVFFVNPNVGWSVGSTGSISKTTDGGMTWTAQTVPTTQAISQIQFIDENLGFAITNGSATNWHKILKTTNGGTTWDSLPSAGARRLSLNDMHFIDANTGFICGWSLSSSNINSIIQKTTDGGATWTLCPSGVTGLLHDIYALDANNILCTGVNNPLLYSSNGGATFTSIAPPGVTANIGWGIERPHQANFLIVSHGNLLGGPNNLQVSKIGLSSFYADGDGDGFGAGTAVSGILAPSGYVSNNTDCNDANAAIHPNATEICNGIDENCNTLVDDGLPQNTFYQDSDGDGFGNPAVSTTSCNATVAGFVADNTDCNDANAAIHPNATEICNNTDDNCNTLVDDGLPQNTFYQDSDGDGFGNPNVTANTCLATLAGYVANNTDCNDANAAVYPGATEICNSINDDCDAFTDEPLAASAVATPANCGGNSGSVNVTPSCGVGPYTYSWSNGATTEDLVNVPGGIYTVSITDSQGLTKTLTTAVTGPVAPFSITSFTYTKPSCVGASNGAIQVNPAAGYGVYTYLWSNGATTKKMSNVTAGTYTVTVMSSFGCQVIGTATLTDPTPLTATSVATAASCPGATNGAVDATVAGGTGAKTYLWSNGATTIDLTNLGAGTYTLTASDSKGCTATTSATVTDASTLTLAIVSTNITCFGLTNGAATASSTGGANPKTFAWSNGSNTAAISNLAAGAYTATVTDGAGCTKTATATINQPTQVTIAVTSVVPVSGGRWRVNLAGAGGTPHPTGAPRRFQRCLVGGSCSSFGSNAFFTNLNPGNYIFNVRDFNGCTASISQTVPPPAPKPTAKSMAQANSKENAGKNGERGMHSASEIQLAANPNPFSDLIKITANASVEQNLTVKMFGLDGRLLLESNWAAGTRTTEINTSNFPAGIYFVKILDTENHLLNTIKVVKAN